MGPIVRGGGKRSTFMTPNPLAGMPDIMGFFQNSKRLFAIEVKNSTGKLSDKQKDWIKLLEKNGTACFVARTLQEVIDWLKVTDV